MNLHLCIRLLFGGGYRAGECVTNAPAYLFPQTPSRQHGKSTFQSHERHSCQGISVTIQNTSLLGTSSRRTSIIPQSSIPALCSSPGRPYGTSRRNMMSIPTSSSDHSLSRGPYSIHSTHQTILKTTGIECGHVRKSLTRTSGVFEPEAGAIDAICDAQPDSLFVTRMARTQTFHTLSSSSSTSIESGTGNLQESCSRLHDNFSTFGMDLRHETESSPDVPDFGKSTRRVMEPHLLKARSLREKAKNRAKMAVPSPIASSIGVPYARLRQERPFLFDIHTHPLHEALAKTLNVQDLSLLHEEPDLQQTLQPLLHRETRRSFHAAYDAFVTSFCIPLLHSLAMSQNLFHDVGTQSHVGYRYQAFPKIRIMRPGDTSDGPQCGTSNGHSVGYLHFHVPLTASMGTSALYTESHPGREDWHPLSTKSVGVGFLFDGARCIHFNMENTTEATSVALDFVIAIYSDGASYYDSESLCSRTVLEDQFSLAGPGFYDDAVIDIGLGSPTWQIVAKKHGHHLRDPDHRVGMPFS